MKILSVLPDIKSIENLLKEIIAENENMAFISYIEGEYGGRCLFYGSIVNDFCIKQKELKNTRVGICFKGNTIFLKDNVDIIIEINSTTFSSVILDYRGRQDGNPTSYAYNGKDGWDNYYTVGIHNDEYENMIDSFNFKNILYTLHNEGGSFSVKNQVYGWGSQPILGKINNEPYSLPTVSIQDYFKPNINLTTIKNDKIGCFIRNTNKHPDRNLSSNIYVTLINYCIINKKHLYIFQDLQPVDIQESEYVHICNIRENGVLLIDKFIDICKDCYIYVGADSGATEICSTYTDCNVLMYKSAFNISIKNENIIFNSSEELINNIDNLYK
jgi:hypothetical protein